ncbi:unnamed protein product [Polarella glacialis]|uniref:protein-tyrosine-phosphatase n=1 Tax=Polarella glacialis TaxID=89957 RepID=A0A813GWD0_POLGL|nr:unnamed protein product [Polarella glacialis]
MTGIPSSKVSNRSPFFVDFFLRTSSDLEIWAQISSEAKHITNLVTMMLSVPPPPSATVAGPPRVRPLRGRQHSPSRWSPVGADSPLVVTATVTALASVLGLNLARLRLRAALPSKRFSGVSGGSGRSAWRRSGHRGVGVVRCSDGRAEALPESALPAASKLRPLQALDLAVPATSSHLRFSKLANWVAPGHLLVGRYPLIDPDLAEGRALVRSLVTDAKVSTFVCFQEEVPPQLELAKWPEGGVKLHGRRCLPYAQLAKQFAGGRPLHFLHVPLRNLQTPGQTELSELVQELEARIREGSETLYLHCWGGRGRSATVAACLLSRLYGLAAEEALQFVQLGYDSRDYDNSPSPETERQRQLVRDFCK